MDLNELAKTSYAVAVEKGWWDGPPRSISDITLLMHSEVSEAVEDYRNHKGLNETWLENGVKPCGIPVEIADFIIRIADYAGARAYDLEEAGDVDPESIRDFSEGLARASCYVSLAWYFTESHSSGSKLKEYDGVHLSTGFDAEFLLSLAAKTALATCKKCGIDIEEAIKVKEAYNRTRSNRHGGKLM